MTDTTTDPAVLAALVRIGDAIFSHKNATVAAIAKLAQAGTVAPPVVTPPVVIPPTPYSPGWLDLILNPTDHVGDAVAVAGKGFKLRLTPGRYAPFLIPPGRDGWDIGSTTNSAADVVIDGGGGLPVDQNNVAAIGTPGRLPGGKGSVYALSPGHIHDVEITGGGNKATGNHDGQAGLYWEFSNGEARATRVMFRTNENGSFGNSNNAGVHYVFDTCDFVNNGTDGGSHDTYVCGDAASSATYLNCHAEGSNAGNNFKSRVGQVVINGGFHGSKNANRWVDAADGAVLSISGGTFVANDLGMNVFANGDESQSKGPGNSTIDGATIYIGNRSANFDNAGTFSATNTKVLFTGPNGSVFNSHNNPLTGMPASSPDGILVAYPAVPPYVSGAK